MRYTRYDYRKPGKMKVFIAVILVIAVSITCGLYLSSLIFKGNSVSKSENNISNTNGAPATVAKAFEIVQCGYYSKKENADAEMTKISSYCYPFISEYNGNYRVIAGLYDDDAAEKKLEEFQSLGIDCAKIKLDVPSNTEDDKKIIEIIDGMLQITKKLDESDIKSIKTAEFKSWSNGVLGNIDNVDNSKISEVKKYIDNLPEEIDKSNISKSIQELYDIIKA